MALNKSCLVGHKDSVLCLSTDGAVASSTKANRSTQYLASGSADGTCRLWDLRCSDKRRCVRAAIVPSKGEVSSVALCASRPELLLAASGSELIGFDLRSEQVLLKEPSNQSLSLSREEINHVAIDPSGLLAAAADDNGAVHLLDLNTWQVDKILAGKKGHDNICSSVAWRPGSSWGLASGGLDASVVFWKRSGQGKKCIMLADTGEESATSTGGPQLFNPPFVHSVAFLHDGRTLAAGLGDGTISLLDADTSEQQARLRGGHTAAVAQVLLTAPGLISAGNDLQIVLWTGTNPAVRLCHHEKVNWLAAHESVLFVAGVGPTIVVYEGLDRG